MSWKPSSPQRLALRLTLNGPNSVKLSCIATLRASSREHDCSARKRTRTTVISATVCWYSRREHSGNSIRYCGERTGISTFIPQVAISVEAKAILANSRPGAGFDQVNSKHLSSHSNREPNPAPAVGESTTFSRLLQSLFAVSWFGPRAKMRRIGAETRIPSGQTGRDRQSKSRWARTAKFARTRGHDRPQRMEANPTTTRCS